MADNLDDILQEIEQNKHKWETGVADPAADESAAQAQRQDKVASFQLKMDIADEFGAYEEPQPPVKTEPEASPFVMEPAAAEQPVKTEPEPPAPAPAAEKPEKKKSRKKRRMDRRSRELLGCAGSIFYVLFIIGISLLLACVIIMGALDLTGLNKSSLDVRLTLEEGVTTEQVTQMLKEHDLIRYPLFFKLYAKIAGDDSEYRSGVYTLSADMGYGNIMDRLRSGPPRKVVNVTIPEGFTVDQIAELMEENAVCTKTAFYDAVQTGDYTEYSFVAEIPPATGDYAGRGYALEGYLFPDTYEFYTGSDGETVVRKLLNNFDNRVNTSYKTRIAASGMSLHDAVTLASIVQAEAANGEWSRVSRVLQNRLADPAQFPYLQCEATSNYYKNLDLTVVGLSIAKEAYDTNVRRGLPPGGICNPGISAINAVLSPSTDKDVIKCYFFATDYSDGTTYYSETHAQHEAICRQYGIGVYAPTESSEDE